MPKFTLPGFSYKKKPNFIGCYRGSCLTAPLIAVMYLGWQHAGLPFPPFALFNWTPRMLPGTLFTFGIDRMIDMLLLLWVSVTDTAKIADQGLAVVLF